MSTSQAADERLQFDLLDRLAKSLRVGNVGKGEMAQHLGVSGNTVGNYLSGRTAPDKRTLIVWAMRCGVPFEWLDKGVTDFDGPTRTSEDGANADNRGTNGRYSRSTSCTAEMQGRAGLHRKSTVTELPVAA